MPDGESVTADNVVELTESTAYARFPSDNKARKQYLQTIAARVVAKMTGNIKSPSALLEALGQRCQRGQNRSVELSPPTNNRFLPTPSSGTPFPMMRLRMPVW